jgi:hypothetical protein
LKREIVWRAFLLLKGIRKTSKEEKKTTTTRGLFLFVRDADLNFKLGPGL